MDNYKDEELGSLAFKNKKEDLKTSHENNFFSPSENIFSQKKEEESLDLDVDLDADDHFEYPDKKKLKRMNFGLWLSESRDNINKIIVLLLILISVGFFSFSLYNLYFYLKSIKSDNFIIENNLNLARQQVSPLKISELNIINTDSLQAKDFVVFVKNENDRFYAKFDYCFKAADIEIDCGTSFILPKQERPIMSLATKISADYSDYNFSISKISWNRISRNILDYDLYKEERLGFLIKDISFNSSTNKALGSSNFNYLDFSIFNPTAFSYRSVPIDILIFEGSSLRGVNHFVINDFKSGEDRRLSFNWQANLGAARNVEIVPLIDIFDDEVFIKYGRE